MTGQLYCIFAPITGDKERFIWPFLIHTKVVHLSMVEVVGKQQSNQNDKEYSWGESCKMKKCQELTVKMSNIAIKFKIL